MTDVKQEKFLHQASGNDLMSAVKLPEGENLDEWLAMHVVDFFNQVTMLYGTIKDKCTDDSCPSMTAGKMEYYWTENDKPVKCTAPVYIDYLFSSVQNEIDDENVFPSEIGKPFPHDFVQTVKRILRRLFRVYAHVYHEHFCLIQSLKSDKHLNTSFNHFILFVNQFELMGYEDIEPLYPLIQKLVPSIANMYNETNQAG